MMQLFTTKLFFLLRKANQYSITVEDGNNCTGRESFAVSAIQSGLKFKNVKSILINRFNTCHSGYSPHAGLDFNNDCDILSY